MDLNSWHGVSDSVWDQIANNLLKALFVNSSLVWEFLLDMELEYKTPERCNPHVVIANLRDCFINVNFAYLSVETPIFNGNKIEIVVNL